MTRSQLLVIGVLTGFVVLVFSAMILLLVVDPTWPALGPTATFIPPLPTETPPITPTLPNFMPTAGPTPTPLPPTATNTRVPTVTSAPTRPPLPTVEFNLPTRPPTDTPTAPPPPVAPATSTPIQPSPTFATRFYKMVFEADDTTLQKGECTNLKWEVIGAVSVSLDGSSVDSSGKTEVCPKKDTRYTLTAQILDFSKPEQKTVEIDVEEP